MNEVKARVNPAEEKPVVETKAPVQETQETSAKKASSEVESRETKTEESRDKESAAHGKPSVKDVVENHHGELPKAGGEKALSTQGAQLAKEAGQVPKAPKTEAKDAEDVKSALKNLSKKMEKAGEKAEEKEKKVVLPEGNPTAVTPGTLAAQLKAQIESTSKASASSKEEKTPTAGVPAQKENKEASSLLRTLDKPKAPDATVAPAAHGKADGKTKEEGVKTESLADKLKKQKTVAHGEPNGAQNASGHVADVSRAVEPAAGEKASAKIEGAKADRGETLGMPGVKGAQNQAPVRDVTPATLPRTVEFLQTVSAQIHYAAVEGRDVLTVKLQPENLGKMTITLGREENGLLTGKLTVESEAVKHMLEAQLSDLKDHLEYGGVVFQDLTVDVKRNSSGDGMDHEQKTASGTWLEESPETTDTYQWVDLRYSDRAVNLLA